LRAELTPIGVSSARKRAVSVKAGRFTQAGSASPTVPSRHSVLFLDLVDLQIGGVEHGSH
jgi:hypothetical protein